MMNSDGTNVRRVTTLPADAMFDLTPRFSSDGRRLVFTATSEIPDDRRCSRWAWTAAG